MNQAALWPILSSTQWKFSQAHIKAFIASSLLDASRFELRCKQVDMQVRLSPPLGEASHYFNDTRIIESWREGHTELNTLMLRNGIHIRCLFSFINSVAVLRTIINPSCLGALKRQYCDYTHKLYGCRIVVDLRHNHSSPTWLIFSGPAPPDA